MDTFTLCYLIVINLVTFLLCGCDKRAAVRREWRIPERLLLFLTIAGGPAGMMAGMLFFHHKTRDPKFRLTVPVVLVAEPLFLLGFYLTLPLRG